MYAKRPGLLRVFPRLLPDCSGRQLRVVAVQGLERSGYQLLCIPFRFKLESEAALPSVQFVVANQYGRTAVSDTILLQRTKEDMNSVVTDRGERCHAVADEDRIAQQILCRSSLQVRVEDRNDS